MATRLVPGFEHFTRPSPPVRECARMCVQTLIMQAGGAAKFPALLAFFLLQAAPSQYIRGPGPRLQLGQALQLPASMAKERQEMDPYTVGSQTIDWPGFSALRSQSSN